MKNMLKILYGSLRFRKKADYIIIPLKVIYIIYSIPFLIFAFLLFIRSFGGFGSPQNEKIGMVKRILLHFSAIFWSYCLWIAILSILEEKLKINLIPHLY
ncbi:MAG: hypothetical protein N3B21_05000 [Clostridia bacterium]|nr:hypothetical protein [Clostridia bacterium]